jgi:hypothetical protein
MEDFTFRINSVIICIVFKKDEKHHTLLKETMTPLPATSLLTIGSGRPQLAGRFCHVLSQQLPVSDPRGDLPVQLLIQELFHSGTCRETAAKATGLSGPNMKMKATVTEQTQAGPCPKEHPDW